MTVKSMSAWDARRNFGKLMDDVANENQPVIIGFHGAPKVGIVPMRLINRWERERLALTEILDRASANTELTEAESAKLIDSEIAKDRAERRTGTQAA